jgi:hypothetical protein
VATKLPNLVIPVTVQTDGVDRGLTAVERKLRNSAAKMKRLGGAAGAAGATGGGGGGLRASQGTALLGGLGKLGPISGALGGLGGAGLAMAAPLALFGMASQYVETMARATKGATEALDLFKQTGEQTFTVNSEFLRKLSALESQSQIAAGLPDMVTAFAVGGARAGEKSILTSLDEFATQAAAFAGGMLGGKSIEQSMLEAQLVTASEAQAKAIAEQIAAIEGRRAMGQLEQFGPLDNIFQTTFYKLDQISIALGKL